MDNIKERITELSPEKLALLIKKLKKDKNHSSDSIMPGRNVSNEYPLSSEQKGIWFLQQLKPESTFYNIPAALRIKGPLNIQALQQALNEIILRHEVLRSNFTLHDDEPRQKIRAFAEHTIEISALEYSDTFELKERIDKAVSDEKNRNFNLAKDSLIRAELLTIEKNDYLLLLTFHHIVSDGWSVGIFVNELSALYKAFSTGKEPELKELPIQYSDYALWQENYLKSAKFERSLSYWKEKLREMPLELLLPLDKKRPTVQSFAGAHYKFSINPGLLQQIRQRCRILNINEFVFCLSAFQILLSKYSIQEDFGIGLPVANRTKLQTQELIGLFTNTVVIRAGLTKNTAAAEILQRTKNSVMEAFEHQECPFERVVNALQPEHNTAISPLFQVLFDFQNRPLYSLEMEGLNTEIVDFERGTSKFDITLSVQEGEDDFKCSFEYSTDLFLEESIKKLSGYYLNIIRDIAANPDKLVEDIQMLPEEDLHQILFEWNNTGNPYPKEETIHHMFELQAEKTPEGIAVVYENEKLTFRELNRRANHLAHRLISMGIGPERLVCLYMERSVDIMVAIFAILKAGGAYLPLDVNSPVERLKLILDDLEDTTVLTHSSLRPRLESENINIYCVDQAEDRTDTADYLNPKTEIQPWNLAYVIYTSGSTGRPKGAMITHQSVVNLLQTLEKNIYARILNIRPRQKKILPVGPDRESGHRRPLKLLLNASVIFDASVQQIVFLAKGHCIYIIPDSIKRDGRAFISYLRKNRIEVMDCVPSQLAMLLESGLLEKNKYCPFLVLPGGEAIGEDIWKELAKSKRTDFFNMYGPTETTVDVTTAWINRSGPRPVIGRPLDNVRLYILDRNYMPQPVGVTGELFIAGDCLGRGYFKNPELTAEKFVPNLFPEIPGERMYRTGDLARFNSDGQIEYLGRRDAQVKIRGFRIELGEIESALNKLPVIKESLVMVREDTLNDRKIVAYIIPKDKETFSAQEIKPMLRGKLPEYMIPSYLVVLEKFPLLPSGKKDKKKLPVPQQQNAEPDREFIPPSTPLEFELVRICESVLNVKNIGLSDNFFELGGDSIKAAIFTNRICSGFKENIPVKAVFENPSLQDLSNYLMETFPGKFSGKSASSPASIKKAPRTGMIPLSYTQERMWFLEQLEPGKAVYNLPIMFRIGGQLNADLLEESLNQIVRRHEILRLSFSSIDGKAQAKVTPQINIKCNISDISSLSKVEQDEFIKQVSNEAASQAIPLDNAPLFRISLLALSDIEYVLIAVFHHIIMDEWSSRLLLTELSEIYNSLKSGKEPLLPELKIQYADYAFWQREYLQGENLQKQLAYWKNKLSGIPLSLELPFDHPRPPVQSYRGDCISMDLSPEIVKHLREFNRHNGVTLFMTMLSAFQVLLFRLSHQPDFAIGTPVANRNKEELESLIGFFVNTLVIRSRIKNNMTFKELLSEVMQTSLEAFTFQDLPFEMLVEALEPERTLSYSPVFQVMFVLQNMPITNYELAPGLSVAPHEIKLETSEFDLTMFIAEKSEYSISMAFEYNTDLFDRGTIEKMFHFYQRILEVVLPNPEVSIKDIALLSSEEEEKTTECLLAEKALSSRNRLSYLLLNAHSTEKVINNWNRRSKKVPGAKTQFFHRLFEEQAETTPERLAVVSEKESLTFSELNSRANRLSRYLMKKGVKAEEVIGVLLGRNTGLITSILAVMKSGAGYLPLDPVYPKGRIEYILKDAGVRFLITEESLLENSALNECEIIPLDILWNEIAVENDSNPAVNLSFENIAYVIYTSGSTGKPKGSIIQHGNLYNYYRIIGDKYSLYFREHTVRVALNTTVMFDASIQQILFILYGQTLYIPPEEVRRDGMALTEYILDNRIDVLDCVPSLLKVFISSGLFGRDDFKPTLVLAGGEALDEALWKELCSIKGTDFFNTYGPTETTVDAAICCVSDYTEKPVIGKPPLNVELYILDKLLNLLPIGAAGELCIGGESLGRGYLKRPELTAEKFIPNPFNGTPGARLYRTGDRARYNPDGTIEFLGRLDNQVKLRGFRIEPGEIEQLLMQHEKVKDAVVILKERNEGHAYLAAYISFKEVQDEHSYKSHIDAIKEFLRHQLPDYMIPSSIVILKEMPLSPNGKIDRSALPEAQIEIGPEEETVPKTENEKLLLQVWKEVLRLDSISLNDNFFEIGGDSILAIQVVAKANTKGLKILTKQVFQYPTIYQLSRTALENAAAKKEIIKGEHFPLTPIQSWFFNQNFPEKNHWNQSVLLELKEKFSPSELSQAFGFLARHHDAFSLRFRPSSGSLWEQFYLETPGEPEVQVFNLAEMDTVKIQPAIVEISNNLQSQLNISEGPLIGIAYFDLGENRTPRLLIAIHHLIIDGVSWRILLKDLELLILQLKSGRELMLPEKSASYQQWSLRIQEYALSNEISSDLDYWSALRKRPHHELPLDFQGNENLEGYSDALTCVFDKSGTYQLLNEINSKYHTKTSEILLSALLLSYAQWSGKNCLLLDLEGHGREEIGNSLDISGTVGWFTSVYPVFLETENAYDIEQTICSVKEQLRSIPHNGFSYQLLKTHLEAEMLPEEKEFLQPQIIFNYLGQFDDLKTESTIFEIAQEEKGIERGVKNKRSHLLEISALVVNGCLNVQWYYSAYFFRKETIQTLSENFLSSVTKIIGHCMSKEMTIYTPSDFQDVNLNQDELKDIFSEINGLGDE